MNDGAITLIKKTPTNQRTPSGSVIYEETSREVFARSVDVARQEAFYAMQLGFRVEYELIINPLEYQGETIAEVNGQRFEIYRTYKSSSNELELYCRQSFGGA